MEIRNNVRTAIIDELVDHDKSHTLHFNEFNDKYREAAGGGDRKITSERDAEELAEMLGIGGAGKTVFIDLVANHGLSAKAAFNHFDINGSGRISSNDLDKSRRGDQPEHDNDRPDNDRPDNDRPDNDRPDNDKPVHDDSPSTDGKLKSFGYKEIPNGEGARINYVKAPNGYSNPNLKVDPKADYILIVSSSGGHKEGNYDPHSPISASHMNIPDNLKDRVVGWVGAKDKGMILVDVRGLDTINFKGKNETEFAWIDVPSGKNLTIDNKASSSNINGMLDPQLGKETVKASSSSDFSIYAEDEGSYKERKDKLKNASLYLDGGDNSLLVLKKGQSLGLSGNGAIAHISIR